MWDDHIAQISSKVTRNINLLRWMCTSYPNKQCRSSFYEAYILPTFDYCDILWNCCIKHQATVLERLQNYAGRIILRERRVTLASAIRERLGWCTLMQPPRCRISVQVPKESDPPLRTISAISLSLPGAAF